VEDLIAREALQREGRRGRWRRATATTSVGIEAKLAVADRRNRRERPKGLALAGQGRSW
jgi:hypothetical protein